MKQFFLLIILCCFCKSNFSQVDKSYKDSIDKYVTEIDSLLYTSRMNFTDSFIGKRNIHFSGVRSFADSVPPCEGYAESIRNIENENLYKLYFNSSCEKPTIEMNCYFKNNKIVFITTYKNDGKKGKVINQYYQKDKIVGKADDVIYLKKAYDLLKQVNH